MSGLARLFVFAVALLGGFQVRVAQAIPLPPAVAGTYLSTPGSRVLIVAAGAYTASLPLAQLLETALTLSGRADEVELGGFLGDIESLSDAAILARVARSRLDEVVIVRSLPTPGPEQLPLAAARFYDLSGRLLTEFRFGEGVAPSPRVAPPHGAPTTTAGGADHPPPPSPPARTALTEVDEDDPVAMQRARASFDTGYLSIRDIRMITWQKGKRGRWYKSKKWVVVAAQGDAEELVPWEIFYEMVQRPDLLLAYENLAITRHRLDLFGAISATAGLPALIAGAACSGLSDKLPAYTLAGVGGGLLLSGIVEVLIARLMSPHPISRPELEQLAADHNRTLRQRFPALAPPASP